MTRGRQPLVALSEAGQIARKRGDTRHFQREPGMICNFVIYCSGFTAHVRIKRVSRLRCPLAVIEREAADALAILRAIAPGPGISRELWVYLPRGSFRFFRVEPGGLVGIDRNGMVLPEKTGPVPGAQPEVPAPSDPAGSAPAGPETPPVTRPPPESSSKNADAFFSCSSSDVESHVGEKHPEKG